jgi:hypothetical protein
MDRSLGVVLRQVSFDPKKEVQRWSIPFVDKIFLFDQDKRSVFLGVIKGNETLLYYLRISGGQLHNTALSHGMFCFEDINNLAVYPPEYTKSTSLKSSFVANDNIYLSTVYNGNLTIVVLDVFDMRHHQTLTCKTLTLSSNGKDSFVEGTVVTASLKSIVFPIAPLSVYWVGRATIDGSERIIFARIPLTIDSLLVFVAARPNIIYRELCIVGEL